MPNTHQIPDAFYELQSVCGDLLPGVIRSHSGLTVPASSMTLAAVAVTGYVMGTTELVYVAQPAVSITLAGSAGTYWLCLHRDLSTAVSGWTRRAGSHYVWQFAASQPANPAAGLVFASVTVAGGVITAVTPLPTPTSQPMSKQLADAVAITDGRISLGGHAPTGVLDVQGSVVASDVANQYYGIRLWPVAPSGATNIMPLRIEASTGAALATAAFRGLYILDQPTMADVRGLMSQITAGANRYNIYAGGTAPNFFAGNVGIQATPASDSALFLQWARATQHGIHLRPTDSDSGGNPAIRFVNMAYGVVGSITTTATTTAYNTSSDTRLKHAVTPLTDALATLLALKPVAFKWNSTDEPDEGFLAHELQQHIPHAVSGEPDQVNEDGSVKPQQVDNSKLVVWLTAALQDAVAQLAAVTARVQALEEALGV